MCLAVPGKMIECDGSNAVVDMQGNRVRIVRVLTPDARPGDWVLVHAGFSISTMDETTALETWDYLDGAYGAAELREEISAAREGEL
ncbi:Hydrogenase isoenzymes formation protein HypC [Phycisphaerae bacterium RAS2]|nr:Hydrogenase isoenzymes formation protein HypC [Phycisphaerae bacterium RAS2]